MADVQMKSKLDSEPSAVMAIGTGFSHARGRSRRRSLSIEESLDQLQVRFRDPFERQASSESWCAVSDLAIRPGF
jgi:hypothetical protein